MAQDFTLRYPLVNGQGNFRLGDGHGSGSGPLHGSPADGDRQTADVRTPFSTVDTGLNYDATRAEPVVCRPGFPNLLVNGTQGIAVGMATSIPPHNLGEVIKACVHSSTTPRRLPAS
ncbi:MAG: hypothetical protein Ct9H300mP1_22220 [Planctomycetaceae bacterium]|nr:MAG: hypothetical protein Ct9H300mP1_22220 [Planctomycetaceae bacterium]